MHKFCEQFLTSGGGKFYVISGREPRVIRAFVYAVKDTR